MRRRERCRRRVGLLELTLAPDPVAAAGLVPGDDDVDEPLEEVALIGLGGAPGELQLLVRLEVARRFESARDRPRMAHTLDAVARPGLRFPRGDDPAGGGRPLLPGEAGGAAAGAPLHHRRLVEPPDLVIADIARIDPDDVADTYPDVPILGFTNHTDTAGLRRAHAAGSTTSSRNRRSRSARRSSSRS